MAGGQRLLPLDRIPFMTEPQKGRDAMSNNKNETNVLNKSIMEHPGTAGPGMSGLTTWPISRHEVLIPALTAVVLSLMEVMTRQLYGGDAKGVL